MKGIVLAGGSGTRLYPSTIATSKQLLNIYDKPLVYYPISVLMLANIKDILIISTPEELPNFKKLLGDGSQFGIRFSYKEQPKPEGIAQAFIIGEEFIGNDNVVLILGDNIFYGHKFSDYLQKAAIKKTGATVFIHKVDNPKQYGVVEFGDNNNIKRIEEKPENPKSNYVVTGLYFYDNKAIEYAKSLKPSQRNELEISDLNNKYLENNELSAEILGRGFSWFDTGTHRSIIQASQYIQAIEDGQGNKIACLEEIAINMGFIGKEQVRQNISKYLHNDYYKYVLGIINNE